MANEHRTLPYDVIYPILASVLQSRLLPHSDDNIFECQTIFSSQCRSDLLRTETERLATTLRLVCRAWDDLVQTIQPHVVVCEYRRNGPLDIPPHVLYRPSEGTALSRVQRMELGPLTCLSHLVDKCPVRDQCRYSRWALTQKGQLGQFLAVRRWDLPEPVPFTPTIPMEQLKVLMPGHTVEYISPVAIMDCAPALKALWWAERWSDGYFSVVLEHPLHKQLTHLKIAINWDLFNGLHDAVEFLNLRYLHLEMRGQQQVEGHQSQIGLGNWATFPKLRILRLCAMLHSTAMEHFFSFLEIHGAGLSSLALDIHSGEDWPRRKPIRITPRLYACVPNLEIFAPGLDPLGLSPPPPPPTSHHPIVVLLEPLVHFNSPYNVSVDDRIASFFQVCQDWGTNAVRLLDSWQEIEALVDYSLSSRFVKGNRETYIPWHLKFYDTLCLGGIDIRDCDGESITGIHGKSFLMKLQRRWEGK